MSIKNETNLEFTYFFLATNYQKLKWNRTAEMLCNILWQTELKIEIKFDLRSYVSPDILYLLHNTSFTREIPWKTSNIDRQTQTLVDIQCPDSIIECACYIPAIQ